MAIKSRVRPQLAPKPTFFSWVLKTAAGHDLQDWIVDGKTELDRTS